MAKIDVLDILRSKKTDPMSFHFDSLWIPPMHYYLSPQDINALHAIATSIRLSSKIQQKYKMIDDVMTARGFKRFSAGTNRVVYRCLEDTRFLVKIAVDKVGMQDNPMEYKNQFLLRPFVTKMFYVSPCGTVGFSERVLPIKNKEEFRQIASDVFDIIVNKILGNYVVEDVGTRYFMNWGIRPGFGPVLLDYPYVYNLDGNKLFCNWTNPMTGELCNGEIDYDAGFNHLVCTRCGKTYLATDLRDNNVDNKIVIKKGGFQMRVLIKKGDQIISQPIPTDDVMVKPAVKRNKKSELVVSINRPGCDTVIVNADKRKNNDNGMQKHNRSVLCAKSVTVSLNTDTLNSKPKHDPVTVSINSANIPQTPTAPEVWSPEVEVTTVGTEFKKDVASSEHPVNNVPSPSTNEEGTEHKNDEVKVETTVEPEAVEQPEGADADTATDNDSEDSAVGYTDDDDDSDDDDSRFERASDVDIARRHNRPNRNPYMNQDYRQNFKGHKKNGNGSRNRSTFIPSK